MKKTTSPNLQARFASWRNQWRIVRLAQQIKRNAPPSPNRRPIAFFNASARIGGLSQNAAFAYLASLGLRLGGLPIVHFVCNAGMSHCIQGTNRENFHAPPPCNICLRQSRRIYSGADGYWFHFQPSADLSAALQSLSVPELCAFDYPMPHYGSGKMLNAPLGSLVLPSIRWALRRHALPDDEDTRYLLREYILSAYNLACQFSIFLDKYQPSAAVIFNGILFPEATARWVAMQRGLRVVTYEVGFQRFSAFFTDGEATAYPIPIPDDFELNPEQNALLDSYLEKRFQGQFTMAGIRFWPEMRGLDAAFLEKAAGFRQIVPIFTNVIYDTSQVHANQVFPHMFAWLDLALSLIREHPETLFVIRAHPDEMRPGTRKQSRESVHDWVKANHVDELPNVIFIDSQEYISSYELIRRAKFVMVYNSSIGMEAALMGAPVLCGGKARYTQYPMVFFPLTVQEHRETAQRMLTAEKIELPAEYSRNARRFLYYQLYCASLSFEDFLQDSSRKGFVELKSFPWEKLKPQASPTLQVLLKGLEAQPPGSANSAYTFLIEA